VFRSTRATKARAFKQPDARAATPVQGQPVTEHSIGLKSDGVRSVGKTEMPLLWNTEIARRICVA
jgi:hypothetical protein